MSDATDAHKLEPPSDFSGTLVRRVLDEFLALRAAGDESAQELLHSHEALHAELAAELEKLALIDLRANRSTARTRHTRATIGRPSRQPCWCAVPAARCGSR